MRPLSELLPMIESRVYGELDDARARGDITAQPGHLDPLGALRGELRSAFAAVHEIADSGHDASRDPALVSDLQTKIDTIFKTHQERGDFAAPPAGAAADPVRSLQARIDSIVTADLPPHVEPAAAAAQQFASTLHAIETRVEHEIARFEDLGVFSKPGHPDALLAMKGEFHRAFEAANARGDTGGATGADTVLQLHKDIDGIIKSHQDNGDLPTAALGQRDYVHDFRTRIDSHLTPHEAPHIEAAAAAKQFTSTLNNIEQRLGAEIVMADSEGVFRIQPGHPDPFLAIKQEFQHALEAAHARGDTSAATGVDPVVLLHKEIDGIIKSHQANGDLPAASAGLFNFQERVDALLTANERPHVDPVAAPAARSFDAGLNDVEARLTTEITKAAEAAGVHVQPGQTDPFLALKGDFHSAFEAAHARGDTSATTGTDPMLQLHKDIDGIIRNHQLNGHLPVAALGEHDVVHDFRVSVDGILTASEKAHVDAAAGGATKQFASTLSDIAKQVGTELVRADIDGIFATQPGHADPYLALKGEFQHAFETAVERGRIIDATGMDPAAAGGDPVVLLHKQLDGIIKSHQANGDLPAAAAGAHDFVSDFQKSIDAILTAHETAHDKGAGPAPAGGHALAGAGIHAAAPGDAPAMLFKDGDMLHGAADAAPHGLANFLLPADQGAPHELGFMLPAALDGRPMLDATSIHAEHLPMDAGAATGTHLDATAVHDIGHALDHAEHAPAPVDTHNDLAHDHATPPLHAP